MTHLELCLVVSIFFKNSVPWFVVPKKSRCESLNETDTPMEEAEESPIMATTTPGIFLSPISSNPTQEYRSEATRLSTFNNWPVTFIQPADLAHAGFIYTGHGDQVRCVFCHQDVGGWESEDFPITEHRRLFPLCPFVQGLDVGNVPIIGNASRSPSQMDRVVIGGIELGDIVAAGIDETGIRTNSVRQASSSAENQRCFRDRHSFREKGSFLF